MENKKKQRILVIFISFFALICIATFGYYMLLNVSLIDALYMTIITISTVGYKEVVDMNGPSKIFSIFVIFSGIGIVGYTFTTLEVIILEGNFKTVWRHKVMKSKIEKMRNHIIIAGGSEGSEVMAERFLKSNKDFVIIEKDEKKYEYLIEKNIPTLQGDTMSEELLKEAGIERASGFISALHSDSDNIVAVLTARHMNRELYIISRSIDKNSREKLMKAGANNTVSSNEIGGNRMAAIMLRPTVISFLDVFTRAGDIELDLEDVIIGRGSSIENQSLRDIQIPQKIGLTVLATKKKGKKKIQFNPNPDEILKEGDSLVVLGTVEQIHRLRQYALDNGERSFDLPY